MVGKIFLILYRTGIFLQVNHLFDSFYLVSHFSRMSLVLFVKRYWIYLEVAYYYTFRWLSTIVSMYILMIQLILINVNLALSFFS